MLISAVNDKIQIMNIAANAIYGTNHHISSVTEEKAKKMLSNILLSNAQCAKTNNDCLIFHR